MNTIEVIIAITCHLCGLVRCQHRHTRPVAFVRGRCAVRLPRDLLLATDARPGTGRHRRPRKALHS